jgi:glyoxylase-like metal-dependent hydrolase (beta-lactamase superfamily II)
VDHDPTQTGQPRIRRITARNPSPLTGDGTNTYVLGSGRVAVIDPGPDDDAHLHAILASLSAGEVISHILITHPHLDHSALAPRLARRADAPILGYGRATDGRSAVMQSLAEAGFSGGGEGLDLPFTPDLTLRDGDWVTGGDWSTQALHTPGHLGSHLCFASGDVLFSGDHVMGWSTTVVSPPDGDMGAYMASLQRMSGQGWTQLLPGHGPAVTDPEQRVTDLIRHRQGREAEILTALQAGPADSAGLTARIYTGLDPKLFPAARRNVLAHLIDLHDKGQVTAQGSLGPETPFKLS